jgi:hypothetical protein
MQSHASPWARAYKYIREVIMETKDTVKKAELFATALCIELYMETV